MKTKKLIASILVICMLFVLGACGGKSAPAPASTTPAPAASTPAPASGTPAAPAPAAAAPAALSLCYVHAVDSPTDLMCKYLAESLNKTGLFEVTTFGQSQYGSQTDLMENLLQDDNILVIAGPSDVADATGITDVGALLAPFLLDKPTETYGLTESDWWKNICNKALDSNVKIIGGNLLIEGARYFWTKTKVVEPSDMAPLKFRVPATTNYLNTFNAFGTTPVSIAVADLYTALQNGTADAFEFPLADAYAYQLYEVSKYVSNQSYVTGVTTLCSSANVWNSLSAEQQAALEACLADTVEYGFGVYEQKTADAKTLLEEVGIEFYDVNVDAYRACVDKYYELSPFSSGLQKTLDDIMTAYRANH